MLEYGLARPEEEQALLDFGNMVFSMNHVPHDFRVLHPRVYGRPGFSRITQVAREEGRILGMISAVTGTLKAGGESLKYGYIGTVSAHPYHRGRGIMKRLMADTLQRLREEGCHLVALGGQRQRYQHFGFEDAGASLGLNLTQASLAHVLGRGEEGAFRFLPFEEGSQEDQAQARRMHQEQDLVCLRSPEDFPLILSTWGAQAHLAYKGQELLGYLLQNGGQVTEFVIKPGASPARACQAFMQEKGLDSLRLILRPFELAQQQELFACTDSWDISPANMVVVYCWESFLRSLLGLAASRRTLEQGSKILDIKGNGRFRLSVEAGAVQVQPTEEAADISLDPQAAIRLLTLPLSEALYSEQPLYNWLPLPFDIPSADSF